MVTIGRCRMCWLANESVRARFGIACSWEFGETRRMYRRTTSAGFRRQVPRGHPAKLNSRNL